MGRIGKAGGRPRAALRFRQLTKGKVCLRLVVEERPSMGIMRAQVDGRIQETDRLLRPARIPQRLTEPEIGLRMTGIEPDRGFELGHRKIELASKGMNTAEGKVPKRVPGIERDCAVRRDLGFGQG